MQIHASLELNIHADPHTVSEILDPPLNEYAHHVGLMIIVSSCSITMSFPLRGRYGLLHKLQVRSCIYYTFKHLNRFICDIHQSAIVTCSIGVYIRGRRHDSGVSVRSHYLLLCKLLHSLFNSFALICHYLLFCISQSQYYRVK